VIALNAHGDVVPPGDGWSVPPYSATVANGYMYGRGAAVSKSDFATYAFALLALRAAVSDPSAQAELPAPLRGAVELHFTFDEEAGGELGPAWLLREGLTRPDYAVCAGFSFAVVTAHNGCLHLEVEVSGLSAHAARPNEGHDALEAATRLLAKLYDWRRGLATRSSATPGIGHPTLVVGKIEGGINTNVVPDRVRFRIDRRIVPEESPAEVERELTDFLTGAIQSPGIAVTVRRLLLAEPLRATEASRRLGACVARHAQAVVDEPVPLQGVPLYTDARHYAARGVPVVLYGAGPKNPADSGAHGPDERLHLDHLHAATRVVGLALAELLGGT
jgi:acetylornithine deacetylase/succinyl-diaminopimelate desuccinylase-like protein